VVWSVQFVWLNVKKLKKRIDEIVANMNMSTKTIEKLEIDRIEATEKIQQLIDSTAELKQRLEQQQMERDTLIIDNKDNFQRKAQIELELFDLQDETKNVDKKKKKIN